MEGSSVLYRLDDQDRRLKNVERDARTQVVISTRQQSDIEHHAERMDTMERTAEAALERFDKKLDKVVTDVQRRLAWVVASMFTLAIALIAVAASISLAVD